MQPIRIALLASGLLAVAVPAAAKSADQPFTVSCRMVSSTVFRSDGEGWSARVVRDLPDSEATPFTIHPARGSASDGASTYVVTGGVRIGSCSFQAQTRPPTAWTRSRTTTSTLARPAGA